MNSFIVITFVSFGALMFLLGYFFPFRMRKFKLEKKTTNSDAVYYVVNINSTDYAFTFEQLDVAEKRAKKLDIDVF
jgi:hypothetical protein